MRLLICLVLFALCAFSEGALKQGLCEDKNAIIEGTWWNIVLKKFLYQRQVDQQLDDLIISPYLNTLAELHSVEMAEDGYLSDINIGQRNYVIAGNGFQWFNMTDPEALPFRGIPLGIVRLEEIYATGRTAEELWETFNMYEDLLGLESKFRHNWVGIGLHCEPGVDDTVLPTWWATIILADICHADEDANSQASSPQFCASQPVLDIQETCLARLEDEDDVNGMIHWAVDGAEPICCNEIELSGENNVPAMDVEDSAEAYVTIPLARSTNGHVCVSVHDVDMDPVTDVTIHHGMEGCETNAHPIFALSSLGDELCPEYLSEDNSPFDFCWRYKDHDIGLSSIVSPNYYFYILFHNSTEVPTGVIRDQLTCGHLRFDFTEGTEWLVTAPTTTC